jgi:bifunctional UDP-N-acetylglucosamine pyrophosphorylase/glucosamine-1-phosphate N-acetyltransferase
MAERSCLAIVLAAGEGTRMRSAMPKAMHKVGGLPMVGHALRAAAAAGAERNRRGGGPSDGGRAHIRLRRFANCDAP